MRYNYYQVYVAPDDDVSTDKVERKLDLALDWIQISKRNFIVYSSKDADAWYERLAPLCRRDGNLFVCRLDVTDRQGWMPKAFWDWLRKPR